MIKRGKKGNIRMRGDKDTIFTDVVRIVDGFCVAISNMNDEDETTVLASVILAVIAEGNSNIDAKELARIIKHVGGKE